MSTQKWTGERLVPSVLNEIAAEHLARYAFTFSLIKEKKVLDLACGEGYGSSLMASLAEHVTGVDADEKIVRHASAKYSNENIAFVKAGADQLPFAEESFDVVVSFETLEHLSAHDEMLKEIKRVLKKAGLLIISTPNKEVYSDQRDFSNKFHQKELTRKEFEELLQKHFKNYRLLFQRNLYGSFIYEADLADKNLKEAEGNFKQINPSHQMGHPSYFVAIASEENLTEVDSLFFNTANIYEERFETLKQTWTYRIGAVILAPVKWVGNLFSNRKEK